jgi:hypothetical protein
VSGAGYRHENLRSADGRGAENSHKQKRRHQTENGTDTGSGSLVRREAEGSGQAVSEWGPYQRRDNRKMAIFHGPEFLRFYRLCCKPTAEKKTAQLSRCTKLGTGEPLRFEGVSLSRFMIVLGIV